MPQMTFVEQDGTERTVDAPLGLSVLEIAHKHGIDLEGACEGSLACATCHVVLAPEWYERLGPPGEQERAMLDCLAETAPTSRLSCQIVLTPQMQGLSLSIPR